MFNLGEIYMKKSLIALAVLAASGAAMAQSSVTLYGIADVWVGRVSVDNGVTDKSYTQMVSGGVSSSRWGMKGSEDLGGGLKANFQLEQAVNIDDGAGTGFTRAANVGFSGGFGAVKIGVAATAYDDAQARSVAVFDADLSPVNGFTLNDGTATGFKNAGAVFKSVQYSVGKAANQIHYQAPNMGGISGAISYALDEDTGAGKATTAFNLTYNGGPIGAELAYQNEATEGNANDVKFLRLGAAYNFGMATAKVQYGKVDNFGNVANAETTEWAIGADIPLSAALTVGVGYAQSQDEVAGVDGEERSGYGIAVAYSLSKRTTVYGGVKSMTYDPIVGADTDVTAYAIGVKHTF
jgi:predicted porin